MDDVFFCKFCKQNLSIEELSFNTEFSLEPFSICKACHHKKKNKQWREANREYLIEKAKQWNIDNQEKHSKSSRDYQKNHPDKVRKQKQEYRKKNRSKVYAYRHNREAKKRNLDHTLTEAQWEYCLEYFGNKCAYCKKSKDISMDHYIPISDPKCVGTTVGNMVPACKSCNSKKYNLDPVIWIYREFSTVEARFIIENIKHYFYVVRGKAYQLGRILYLCPHRDDECLSAGGLLGQHSDNYTHIHYFNSVHPLVEQFVYDNEAEKVKQALKCAVSYSKYQKVNELHTFPITVYITEIENIVNKFKPDTVIVPAQSYNSDHRVVYNSAITALRIHDTNWIVKNVLLAEQPETHTSAFPGNEFIPQFFVPIDIDKKLNLYSLYESQQRGHRTLEHIKALAQLRGMQCGVPFAEAFQIVRMVI